MKDGMRRVLITGAAGGIGTALVRSMRERGWTVYAGVNRSVLEGFEHDSGVVPVRLDVTDRRTVERAYEEIRRTAGGLDAVVNNAGLMDFAPFTGGGFDTIRRVHAVNVEGPLLVTEVFLPLLAARRGRVVNISSEEAKAALPFDVYGYSKRCLEALSDVQRLELAFLGIDVVVIRPGAHETAFLDRIRTPVEDGAPGPLSRYYLAFQELAGAYLPASRDPRDVAETVCRALTVRRPRRVYEVNVSPMVSVLALLPSALHDLLIRLVLERRVKKKAPLERGARAP